MSHDNDLFTTLDGLTSAEEKVAHSFENLTINELEVLLRQEGLTKEAKPGVSIFRAGIDAAKSQYKENSKAQDRSEKAEEKSEKKGKDEKGIESDSKKAYHKHASAEPSLEEKVKQADAMGRQMAHTDHKTKDLIGKADLEKVALGLSNMGAMAGKAVNAIKSNPMARNAVIGAGAGSTLGFAKQPAKDRSRLGGALKGGLAGGAIGAASGNAKVQSMARAGLDRAKNVAGATAFRAGQAMGKK